MKPSTKFLHNLLLKLKLDPFIASLNVGLPLLKLLPLPGEYPIGATRLIVRDRAKFLLDPNDYMQWYIYSSIVDKSWLYAFKCTNAINRPVIIDIGSNVGAFCLKTAACFQSSGKQALIHAFEPQPLIFNKLLTNFELNPSFSHFINAHLSAVGAHSGVRSFSICEGNSGGSSLSPLSPDDLDDLHSDVVDVVSLDEFVSNNNLDKLDFIKIDVEGFEPEVCAGSKESIQKYYPSLYIEITPSWHERNGFSSCVFIDSLIAMGYLAFIDKGRCLSTFLQSDLLSRPQFNLLFIHASKASCILKSLPIRSSSSI